MQALIKQGEYGALVRVIESTERYHIHEGKAFKAKTGDPALASAATKIIAFKTPAGDEDVHLILIPDSSLSATTELLEGPTVTVDTGTPTPWKNRNRKLKATLSGMLSIETTPQPGYYNLDPTITADGTVLDTVYTNAGTKQSDQRDSLEWQLDPDTVYAIRLTSNAAANLVNLGLIAYETEEY